MTGILDYISSSFFQKPVSPDPSKTQWTYNLGYKFTSMTGTFLFFASCLVFARELIGDHIHCISDATNGRVSFDEVGISLLKFSWIKFYRVRKP